MMLGPGPRFTGPYGTLLVIAASIVVLALVFVAPVDGQAVSSEHRFQLVHPIFSHVHWDGAGHHDLDEDDVNLAVPAGGPDVTVLPAGPFGPGPLVTTEGMHVPAL